MAPPTRLAHVVYMTRRFDEMVSWYKKVFEARVQYQNPAFAFLTYDDEHHRDPDGNRMEFQVDCCAHADEAHAFMHSDAFAANPIGVGFDPDALLTQYRNGVPVETLLVQPEGAASSMPPEHGLS